MIENHPILASFLGFPTRKLVNATAETTILHEAPIEAEIKNFPV